jgi:hypothetical protein
MHATNRRAGVLAGAMPEVVMPSQHDFTSALDSEQAPPHTALRSTLELEQASQLFRFRSR